MVLINQNRKFLTGQESDPRLRQKALDKIKAMPGVERVAYLRMEYVGPRKLLLVASVDIDGEQPESTVAYTLRDLEGLLEQDPNVVEAVLTLATPDEPGL